MLQLHGRVEVVMANMARVVAGHQAHNGVANLMIYLVMDGHRKLVVHSCRNLMVAPMMYSYRDMNLIQNIEL